MNFRIYAIVSLILTLMLVALVTAQTSNTGTSNSASGTQGANATSQQKSRKVHLPSNFSADEAYKQNCTRCHSEVPKLDPKRTNTIMRHMRVRANLTKDEAQAILDYLRE